MAYKRQYFQEITIAANTSLQQFAFTPPDTFQDIKITGIYSSDHTARHAFGLQVNGDQKVLIGATIFTDIHHVPQVDVDFPKGATCNISAEDLTGTGLSNVGVTVFYEVNQG